MPELRILIDAVQAASFITEKKTLELVDKIAALGGSNPRGDIEAQHRRIQYGQSTPMRACIAA